MILTGPQLRAKNQDTSTTIYSSGLALRILVHLFLIPNNSLEGPGAALVHIYSNCAADRITACR